jgi:xanthine dehydrogenase YagS FAD-binding subunit
MHPFTFTKVTDNKSAISITSGNARSKYLGGGTNLIDLIKMNIEKPELLVDITGLDLKKIETLPNGNVRIGSLVRNSDLAYDTTIMSRYPLLSKALLSGASPQLRNMATTGGNLLQRTRCSYFYDIAMPCNKREPGSGCSAINGYNRNHAILGTSDKCIATHPSDMCVAMAALDAVIHVQGTNGERSIPFRDFHSLPGDTPEKDTALQHGELITFVEIPALPFAVNSTYLKVRDRASYDFALASVAIALDVTGGIIKAARIALGGVGTKPWRAISAEQSLAGKPTTTNAYKEAAGIALEEAKTYKYNAFKTELAKRTIISALQTIGGIV